MDLALKYRPRGFKEVVGHKAVVASLQKVLEEDTKHAFLFHGPSGTGKTTLARIIAHKVGCIPANLIEVDAATYTGVDAMRELTSSLHFSGMGGSPVKMVIIDEAHDLSKAAWESVLKILEEPPKHVYWCFCTTEFSRVQETIRTRCACYQLQLVATDDIYTLLNSVVAQEKLDVVDDVVYFAAEKAMGSPRRALTYLAQMHACDSRKAAAEVIHEVVEDDADIGELCRGLLKGIDWKKAVALVKPLEGQGAEGIRIAVEAYMTKVLLGTSDPERAIPVLRILENFAGPWPYAPRLAPVLVAVGDLVIQR